jgi:hypothetical protein
LPENTRISRSTLKENIKELFDDQVYLLYFTREDLSIYIEKDKIVCEVNSLTDSVYFGLFFNSRDYTFTKEEKNLII